MSGIQITDISTTIPDIAGLTTDLLIECLDLSFQKIDSYGTGV